MVLESPYIDWNNSISILFYLPFLGAKAPLELARVTKYVRPYVRPYVRTSIPPCPILRASSPLGPILTQILPNSPNPSNIAQI